MGRDSLAVIAPADTAIGRPIATARRLVNASVSANTSRAYAGAQGAESRGSSGSVRSPCGGSGCLLEVGSGKQKTLNRWGSLKITRNANGG